jgi:hypothetical protein
LPFVIPVMPKSRSKFSEISFFVVLIFHPYRVIFLLKVFILSRFFLRKNKNIGEKFSFLILTTNPNALFSHKTGLVTKLCFVFLQKNYKNVLFEWVRRSSQAHRHVHKLIDRPL